MEGDVLCVWGFGRGGCEIGRDVGGMAGRDGMWMRRRKAALSVGNGDGE